MLKIVICSALLSALVSVPGSFAEDGPAHTETPIALEPTDKALMKISPCGFTPPSITLQKRDGSIFFLNSTKRSLVTLQVKFGKKMVHCASSNLRYTEAGDFETVEPIAPKDFAVTCFPEPGEYEVVALGVEGQKKPVVGKVTVR